MFEALGLLIKIKWFRIRKSFDWNNISVDLDFTYGYGHILELEMLIENESDVESTKNQLKSIFDKLNIAVTKKEVFNQKFADYEKNWAEYTKDLNEEIFMNM